MRLFLPSGIMLSWSHSGRERRGAKEEEAAVSGAEEKNKALVCRFFEEVFKRGNLGVADELLAADFAWKLPGKDAGIEDYKQWVAEQLASSSDLHFSIEEQIAEGEKVVTRLIGSGTHDQQEFGEFTPRGVRITIEAIIIHRVVEGKIVEERNKADFSPFWQQRLEQERIERERVDQELQVARDIQLGSLAQGVPAAIVTTATAAYLGAVNAASDSSPGEALALANEALFARIPANMFVTCFYAVLDPESATLTYANAGHELPYLHRNGDAEELRARGMPLGMMPGMSYEEGEVSLAEGECVLFHSDGLVERPL